jgi:hypothetical protein
MKAYLQFFISGRYKYGFSLPAVFLFVAFFPLPYLVHQYNWFSYDLAKFRWIAEIAEWWPYGNPWVIILGITIALFWAIWFGYKLLNDEMEKRDAEDLKRSPEMRLDRAYRVIHELIKRGDMLINNRGHPDDIEAWDTKVQSALAAWCQESALQIYKWNSRLLDKEKLENPGAALEHLKGIHERLDTYLK